jgi:hypothetical protein
MIGAARYGGTMAGVATANQLDIQQLLHEPDLSRKAAKLQWLAQQFRVNVLDILAVAFLAALCAGAIFGQAAMGNIRGTVTDTSGGIVPNCSVTLTNVNTSLVRKVSTDSQGVVYVGGATDQSFGRRLYQPCISILIAQGDGMSGRRRPKYTGFI